MLPSRRLLTSRRRGECRCPERIECDKSASVYAVESVVQAMVRSQGLGQRRRLEVRHLLRNVQKQNRHQHWVHGLALQEQAVHGIVT